MNQSTSKYTLFTITHLIPNKIPNPTSLTNPPPPPQQKNPTLDDKLTVMTVESWRVFSYFQSPAAADLIT